MAHSTYKKTKTVLGKRKSDIQLEYEDQFVASAWIDARSKGALKYPLKTFYFDVKLMEHLFREYHRETYDGLSREPNVTKNFTNVLVKKFGQGKYDINTLQSFSFVRHMSRLKSLQRHLASTVESVRSKSKRIEYSNSHDSVKNTYAWAADMA